MLRERKRVESVWILRQVSLEGAKGSSRIHQYCPVVIGMTSVDKTEIEICEVPFLSFEYNPLYRKRFPGTNLMIAYIEVKETKGKRLELSRPPCVVGRGMCSLSGEGLPPPP